MKRTLIFAATAAVIISFALISARADNGEREEIYREQYESLEADRLKELLPEDMSELADGIGFDPSDPESLEGLSAENIFTLIINMLTKGLARPFSVLCSVLAVLLTASLISGAAERREGIRSLGEGLSSAAVAAVVLLPAYSCFRASVNALKAAAVFMLGFVPIFAGILAASGKSVTSSLTAASLLTAAEAVEQISAFVVLPAVAVVLSLGVASVFSGRVGAGCVGSVKRLIGFCMTAVMTVFSAVISVQSFIGGSADSLSLRAAKYVASGAPVIGGAVSEAAGVVSSCLGMLKGSAAVYAVICLCSILLPVLLEALVWRAAMHLLTAAAGFVGAERISGLTGAVEYSFGIVTSVTLSTFIMFTVSVTVTAISGGGG